MQTHLGGLGIAHTTGIVAQCHLQLHTRTHTHANTHTHIHTNNHTHAHTESITNDRMYCHCGRRVGLCYAGENAKR